MFVAIEITIYSKLKHVSKNYVKRDRIWQIHVKDQLQIAKHFNTIVISKIY